MSSLPHDPESDDIFGHLLDYQQTEEFHQTVEAQQMKERVSRRPRDIRASRTYRQNHPDLVKLRKEAQQYKEVLFAGQSGVCRWCSKLMTGKYEVDHIKPLIKGGTNDIANLCVCHPKCNRSKGSKDVI